MSGEKVNTIVIGAGQAGLAMSEHLAKQRIDHVVLERHRIAERWRSERWDSFVANGPAWHDRLPSFAFDHVDPDTFANKEQIVTYFESYAHHIAAPVRSGVEVQALRPAANGGFLLETSVGPIESVNVVVATGPFQRATIPPVVPSGSGIWQIHSAAYRNPGQPPDGGVLVIGAGSSGAQIADELLRAGRSVYLAIGPHQRPPRRYRGKDFSWWMDVLGHWETTTPSPAMEHVTIAVSGARGGHTVDYREFANRGMILIGRSTSFSEGKMHFADDLAQNLARGDAYYLSVLDEADAYLEEQGLRLPEEPEARQILPQPKCVTDPVLALDLAGEGVTSIIWATGFALDFGWIEAQVFEERGRPVHKRGVTAVPGLYFLGLPWLHKRQSPFIWGVWHDAEYICKHLSGATI